MAEGDARVVHGPEVAPAPDLVAAARSVAASTLFPRAQQTDLAERVPSSNLDALVDAGLFGLAGPQPGGGQSPPPNVVRDVHEALAGACGATYFVWAQHHTPVRMLSSTNNEALRSRWLEPLCAGRKLAGVVFAYLRWDTPAVSATPVPGGYRVTGVAPWATSWGMADVFVVAAPIPGEAIVWFCLNARADDSVRPSAPLQLAAMQSTSTVRLTFDDLFVPDADVVLVEPIAAWRRRDRVTTAQPAAAALGVAATSCRLLAERAEATGSRAMSDAARHLTAELRRCREHSYRLADAPVPSAAGADLDDHLARLIEARAWNLELAQRASWALVTASGGAAVARTHPAQRLVREAAFYAVQAQTVPIRRASLHRLARSTSA